MAGVSIELVFSEVTCTDSRRLLRQSQTRTVPSTEPEITRLESSLNCTQFTRPRHTQTVR